LSGTLITQVRPLFGK
jgi:N-alpha-acetyltransferase 15/16, NatA auxiliary subunit